VFRQVPGKKELEKVLEAVRVDDRLLNKLREMKTRLGGTPSSRIIRVEVALDGGSTEGPSVGAARAPVTAV
jgi:hypothetical protein